MIKTLVAFIQDRSGSMSDGWKETVNGFKVFVEQLQKDQASDNQVEYTFAFTAWDTQIDALPVQPIAQVPLDLITQYPPRGGTALYDAVGKTLVAMEENAKKADKILVIVVTDGQENSSREWSKDGLHAAIDERIKRGNWTFTYLGTQPETWDDASKLGMGVGASAVYDASNAHAMYATVAMSTSNLTRSVHSNSRSLLSDEKFTPRAVRAKAGVRTAVDKQPVSVSGTQTGRVTGSQPGTKAKTRSWK